MSAPKNPRRVPSTLWVADPTITEAARLDTPITEGVMIRRRDNANQGDVVPDDGIYEDDKGRPVKLVKGEPMPPGLTPRGQRSQGAAPENRAEPEAPETPENRSKAPENRGQAKKD